MSFQINAAETVCLTGPSGVGKSMLLRAIADLIPHQGEVFLDDVACQDIRPSVWRKRVAYLAAESQWWADSVGEHFISIEEEKLQQLGFAADVLQWQVARLSSGEKQRLALLRVLANQPLALLLDEPTASLDALSIDKVENLIKYYQSEHDVPVLWVSHQADQVQRVASRVMQLHTDRFEEVAA